MSKNINQFSTVEIDGTSYCCVEHIPTGYRAIFEYDDDIKQSIEEYARLHRKSLTVKHNEHTFCFPKSRDGTSSIQLAAFLYGQYYDMPLDDVRGLRVRHTNGTFLCDRVEDCRKCNLSASGEIILKNTNREFCVLQDPTGKKRVHIIIDGVSDYMDYEPPLLNILMEQGRFTFSREGAGKIQVRLSHSPDGVRIHNPYLSQIAGAYYHGMIDLDNFEASLLVAIQQLNENGLEIDHLLSDTHNHCRYNLSIISSFENRSKKSRGGAFEAPYCLYGAVTPDGQYLLELIYNDKNMLDPPTWYYAFPDMHNLNTWLQAFFKKGGLLTNTRIDMTGMGGAIVPVPKQINPDAKPLQRDFMKDCTHAEQILELYRDYPGVFQTKDNWGEITLKELLQTICTLTGSPKCSFRVKKVGQRG